jgi:Xaa-Pro aminopeptidase
MHDLGTLALEDGGRIDFARLRRERLERCLAEMARRDLDALVLGREANARYVSGVRRLWTAGTRPFGPGCVVVRTTGQVHLMSLWDAGMPAEVSRQNYFPRTWNPLNHVASLKGIPGLAEARRVGVDGLTAQYATLLPVALPGAALVDGEEAMRAARRLKTGDEVACIRTAVAVAEACLDAAVAALRPGIGERELLGAFEGRLGAFGLTIPAQEGTFCATPKAGDAAAPPLRQLVTDNTLNSGDLVAMSSGVLYAGYEGGLGRSFPCGRPTEGQERLLNRWRALWVRLSGALGPGRTGADLRQAYVASGEPLPPLPIAHGLGLGVEAPVVGGSLGEAFEAGWTFEPGMVLSVQGYVWEAGAGGYLGRETVLITEGGHEVLSRFPHGPFDVD